MAEQDRNTLKGYLETGDTPTEAQFSDLIDSFLNKTDESDQIIPTPNTGDAGKVSRIKSDESGWESYDDVIVGEGSSHIKVKGTLSDILRHDGVDLDSDTKDFRFKVHTADFAQQTRTDVVYQLGYNLDDSGREDNSDHAFGWQYETFFKKSGTAVTEQWELFVRSDDVNGNKNRILSLHGPVDDSLGDPATDGDDYVRYAASAWVDEFVMQQPVRGTTDLSRTQRVNFDFIDNLITLSEDSSGNGLKLFNDSNNTQFIRQADSSGDSIALLYMNSSDAVVLGQAGYEVQLAEGKIRGVGGTKIVGGGILNIGDSADPVDVSIVGETTNLLSLEYDGDTDSNAWDIGVFEDQFFIQYGGSGNNVFVAEGSAPADSLRVMASGSIKMSSLPTTNPGGSGLIWNDGGTLKIT